MNSSIPDYLKYEIEKPKNRHAQALGKLGRKVCSEAQARASRLNGAKHKKRK